MKHINNILLVLLLTQTARAEFKVHEWGTFTSVIGSNGKTQNGLYHEDEKLPDFIHGLGEVVTGSFFVNPPPPPVFPFPDEDFCGKSIHCRVLRSNVITQKMETPVLYFYHDSVTSVPVKVNVQFPLGVISQTFPGPTVSTPGADATVLSNGAVQFDLNIVPRLTLADYYSYIPQVPEDNIYSYARNVDSNYIQVANGNKPEYEKFIFYRGLGQFNPRFQMTSKDGNLSIEIPASGTAIPYAYLINVGANGNVFGVPVHGLSPGHTTRIGSSRIAEITTGHGKVFPLHSLKAMLAHDLTDSGLFADEALAMIATWENGYFKVPGLRLLYILPRNEVETILPMQVSPSPAELNRAFVGRIEVLLDVEESEIINLVTRQGYLFDPESLGRFAEPKLRRALEVYQAQNDASVEMIDLFNELISYVLPAANGNNTVIE